MKDREIDDILKRAAEAPPAVDPALLDRVSASMRASLRPVRPMAPAWMQASVLWLIAVGIAVAVACLIGLDGIQHLGGVRIATIFVALGIFTWLVAMLSVDEITPGSKRWIHPAMLLLLVLAGWIAVDALLFHDYQIGAFLPEGIPCLRAGLIVAVPTGVAGWLALRKGFAMNPTMAGLAAGTLAGLAGLMMLEMHCPNFHAMHVMVWHTAVVPISAIVGAMLANRVARR